MKNLIFATLFLFSLTTTFAQVSSETTIDENFQELITNSNNFKGYKVVDTEQLIKLQQLTSNRIAELKAEISTSKKASEAQEEKMAELQAEVEAMQSTITQVNNEKDSIEVMGMSLSKASYNTIMWTIIGILVVALVLFIVRYKRSYTHTSEARKNLAELEKEFDAYRAKALEKEQRLGRLLQDEKNKHLKVAK